LEEDPKYRVSVFKLAEEEVPGPEVCWQTNWDTWETLYFLMMVVRGNGITTIVNTGPPKDLTKLNLALREHYGSDRGKIIVREEERPWNVLSKIGVDPEKVDYVIVTPFQSYSISNVDLFPNAKICLSKKGWLDFQAPRFPYDRHNEIPDDILIYLETTACNRVRLLEDEDSPIPGIQTFWTGCHHRNSIAVCVNTEKGNVIFTDCSFKYVNVEGGKLLGCAESLEECMTAYDRIRRVGQIVIPAYDPIVLERYNGGSVV